MHVASNPRSLIAMYLLHADLTTVDDNGRTPLHYAVMHGAAANRAALVVLLLQLGVDPNVADTTRHRFTAGHEAICSNYRTELELMLQGGLDPDAGTPSPGETCACSVPNQHDLTCPIHLIPLLVVAVRLKNLGSTRLLLEAGSRVDVHVMDHEPPLMHAAKIGDKESVKCLLAHGADKTLKNREHQTALMIAEARHHRGVVMLLSEPTR